MSGTQESPASVPVSDGSESARIAGLSTATACDAYCDKHAVCRLLNDQPVHYFDCDRFQIYNYGLKQGTCDCTATADVNQVLDAAYTAGYRQSVEDNA